MANRQRESRIARVTVVKAFGHPCPVGYKEGDDISADLSAIEGELRCPGVRDALEPYLDAGEESHESQPMRFSASCHCPYSRSEVVFDLRLSPPLHQKAS